MPHWPCCVVWDGLAPPVPVQGWPCLVVKLMEGREHPVPGSITVPYLTPLGARGYWAVLIQVPKGPGMQQRWPSSRVPLRHGQPSASAQLLHRGGLAWCWTVALGAMPGTCHSLSCHPHSPASWRRSPRRLVHSDLCCGHTGGGVCRELPCPGPMHMLCGARLSPQRPMGLEGDASGGESHRCTRPAHWRACWLQHFTKTFSPRVSAPPRC